MSITTRLKDKLLRNTGFFEGDKGYSQITGNFDGQGISFGIIQFNFGQGTLQPVLKDFINSYSNEFYAIFGQDKGAVLNSVVFDYSKSEQINWGNSISEASNKYRVKSEWRVLFEELGENSNCIKIQQSNASSYINRALYFASKFDIRTTQGLAFLFDHAVQSWSFNDSYSAIIDKINEVEELYKLAHDVDRMPDKERLGILLRYISGSDPIARRTAIKNGYGRIHGKDYDISNFSLSYNDNF